MSKKAWFYVLFFMALSVVFYFIIGADLGSGSSSKLGVIVNDVPDFNFTDQNKKTFNQYNTHDKVYVANYFFTTCKGICPKMNANMRLVYDKYKSDSSFLIVSHTCDPETDSVPVLKAYESMMVAGKLSKRTDGTYAIAPGNDSAAIAQNHNWFFVTGDKKNLYDMARYGYMIDNGKPDTSQIEDQFMHSQFFALVDRQSKVRGIYDGLKLNEVEQMMKDIDELLNEQTKHKGFMGGFSVSPN